MITRWAADLVPAEVISLPEEDRPAAAADEPPAPKKPKNVNIRSKYLLKQLSGSNTANGSNSTSSTTPHQTAKRQMEMYLSYDHGEIEVNSEGVPTEKIGRAWCRERV